LNIVICVLVVNNNTDNICNSFLIIDL